MVTDKSSRWHTEVPSGAQDMYFFNCNKTTRHNYNWGICKINCKVICAISCDQALEDAVRDLQSQVNKQLSEHQLKSPPPDACKVELVSTSMYVTSLVMKLQFLGVCFMTCLIAGKEGWSSWLQCSPHQRRSYPGKAHSMMPSTSCVCVFKTILLGKKK